MRNQSPNNMGSLTSQERSVEASPDVAQGSSLFNDRYHTMDWTAAVFSKRYPSYQEYDLFIRVPLSQETVTRITNTDGINEIQPRLSRDSKEVIFASDETGNFDIYRMNIDGSQKRNLTHIPGDDYSPVWSIDNLQIAYVHELNGVPQIFIMNADGTGNYQLTYWAYGGYNPSFSPDGTQLVYTRTDDADGMTSILVSDRDGSNCHILPGSEYYPYPATPSWSPDGEMIAFSYMNFNPFDVRVVIIDTTDGTVLNDFSYYLEYGEDYFLLDILVYGWSPDSKYISFTLARYYYYYGYLEFCYASADGKLAMPAPDTFYDYDFGFNTFEASENVGYPDWQSADEIPPRTSLQLPEYSRYRTNLFWDIDSTGLAWISDFEIQTRNGESGLWQSISNPAGEISTWTPEYTYSLPALPAGSTQFYQARAKDIGGHWEEFSALNDQQTKTTYYNWNIQGTLLDNRNRPIQNQSLFLTSEPVLARPSDDNGRYHWLIGDPNILTLDVERPGYGDIPSTSFLTNQDYSYDVYLPPVDNLLNNGEFETGDLDGWSTSGGLPAKVTSSRAHSGNQSLLIGVGCPQGCMSEPGEVIASNAYSADLIYDPEGTLYNIISYYGPWEIRYRSRNGEWGQSLSLGELSYSPYVTISPTGRFYVIYLASDNNYYGYYRDPNGLWSSKFLIGRLGYASYADWIAFESFAADYDNNLRILMYDRNSEFMYHRYNIQTGELSSTLSHEDVPAWRGQQVLIVLPDNSTAIISVATTVFGDLDGSYKIQLNSLDTGITYDDFRVFQTRTGYPSVLILDRMTTGNRYYLRSMDSFLNWSVPEIIFEQGFGTSIKAGACPDGSILLESNGLIRWFPGKEPEAIDLPVVNGILDSIYCDADSLPVAVYSKSSSIRWTFYMFEGRGIDPAITTEASQQVIIPAEMYNPTLSFAYQMEYIRANGQTGLEVLVRDQNDVETQLHYLKGSNPWRQEWADLRPWAGQTISIVFRLNQAANEPNGLAWIDGVAVGSWETPYIYSVEPNFVTDLAQAPEITIHGENFNEAITVYFDGNPLDTGSYSWLDDQTLKIFTPDNLERGCITLKVVNPGGAESERSNAFCYLYPTFLPVVSH